ncbi:MAG: hypothetical protein PHG24_02085 [Candidatus Pacebacteria bacterium]|nr:hypothetical protein [Candidatus Paceibacterota bacterium]
MEIKIIFSILASIVGVVAFLPYLKDVFSSKTKPHIYTWLIWIITQGTAVAGMIYGGADWGSLSLAIGLIFVTFVFLLSFKYGTKDITKSDTVILIFALLAIIVWWQLKNPILSVLMVSIIDVFGFIPSFRKTFNDPWSETLSSWGLFATSNILALLAMSEYNFLTIFYVSVISIGNILVFLIALIRRKQLQNV